VLAGAAADGTSEHAAQLGPAAAPGRGARLDGGNEGVGDNLVWIELSHSDGLRFVCSGCTLQGEPVSVKYGSGGGVKNDARRFAWG